MFRFTLTAILLYIITLYCSRCCSSVVNLETRVLKNLPHRGNFPSKCLCEEQHFFGFGIFRMRRRRFQKVFFLFCHNFTTKSSFKFPTLTTPIDCVTEVWGRVTFENRATTHVSGVFLKYHETRFN